MMSIQMLKWRQVVFDSIFKAQCRILMMSLKLTTQFGLKTCRT